MKKYIILALVGFIGFSLQSCKEDEKNVVKGEIREYPNENSLSNVSVKLEAKEYQQGSFSDSWKTVDQSTTSSDGKYQFEFESMRINQYRLTLNSDTYREIEVEFPANGYVNEYIKNFKMYKSASLNIRIKNQNLPVHNLDVIRLRITDIPTDCDGCSSEDYHVLNGAIDTTISYELAGNDDVILQYTTEKNGTQNSEYHTATINIQPGVNNTINIIY